MKILLTGSQGFIGSKLNKALLDAGYIVYGYDLTNGDDIRDGLKLDKLFEKHRFDAVIHLAALAGVLRSEAYPDEYISTNIKGTHLLIKFAQKYNVGKFVLYSSSSVLGGNNTQEGLKETDAYDPHSLYANTKMFNEYDLKASGLNYLIIRPFTVYGEYGRPDMLITKWINTIRSGNPIQIYGDTASLRGYTYVGDLVESTLSLFANNKSGIYHLGGSEIISLNTILVEFEKYCKKKDIKIGIDILDRAKEDVKDSFADTTKANTDIGFGPSKVFIKNLRKILSKEL